MDVLSNLDFQMAGNGTRLFQDAPTPIAIFKGREMRYVFINEPYACLFNKRDILGKTMMEAFPELEGQPYQALLEEVFDTGLPFYGNEIPAIIDVSNSGALTTHYYNLVYSPYLDDEGNIEGVMAFATDVTEQVEIKQKLIRSDDSFRNMVLQSPVAMCVLKGSDFIVEVANRHMFELWGKEECEVLNLPLFKEVPELKEGFKKVLERVYYTGRRFTANERPVTFPRNGRMEKVYLNFVYEAFRDLDGSIAGVIAVATEVTELVNARHKVEYAEESARMAIGSADLGTYELNLITDEMFTNHRFNVIWGIGHPTTDRSAFAAYIHPDDMLIRDAALIDSVITGNLDYEVRLNWATGIQRWVKVKGKVLYDKQGAPMRLLGVIQDISEQKSFAEELSKKVEERTKELKNTNEHLERSNEYLEQFAYIASHDLQEPLRKIQLFNTLVLEKYEIPDASKKYITKVNEAANRMTGLIRDLLEYSRITQKSLHFEKTDLNTIAQNILTDFEVLIMQKNAIVELDELPVLEGIQLQMNQLFYNLVGNALKFTRKDVSPRLRISSAKLSEERKNEFPKLNPALDYYEISISDNGIGFNQEYADKIFTIFQRLNEKSLYGGYGIGLALCRKIVDNHSGIIYAEGDFTKGSTFIFILPSVQHN